MDFRQMAGITMGSDLAPYFANLCVGVSKVVEQKENNILARKFGNIFIYIDNLLAINDEI